MNKKRCLLMAIMFIFTLFLYNNVKAVQYGFVTCDGHYWTPQEDCREEYIDSNGNKKYKLKANAVQSLDGPKITFNSDGSVDLNNSTNPYANTRSNEWRKFNNHSIYFSIYSAKPYGFDDFIKNIDDIVNNKYSFMDGTLIKSKYKVFLYCVNDVSDSLDVIRSFIAVNSNNILSNSLKNLIAADSDLYQSFENCLDEMKTFFEFQVLNYEPIENYYRQTGNYPNVLVTEKYFAEYKIFGISYKITMYVYYPSDLFTSGNYSGISFDFFETPDTAILRVLEDFGDVVNGDGYLKFASDFFQSYISILPAPLQMNANYDWKRARDVRYYALDLSDDNANINSCDDLTIGLANLKAAKEKYGTSSDEFSAILTNIDKACDYYMSKREENQSFKSECFDICTSLEDRIYEIDPTAFNKTNECGFGQDMTGWLIRILKIIRYIVPIIVIILSIFDYITALTSAEDDAIKKAGAKFGRRLFIMVLIFVLPSLIQFLLGVFNIDGFNPSNPYCLKN